MLFDLPAKEGPKNGIVLRALENLKKLSPAPLGDKNDAALIVVRKPMHLVVATRKFLARVLVGNRIPG